MNRMDPLATPKTSSRSSTSVSGSKSKTRSTKSLKVSSMRTLLALNNMKIDDTDSVGLNVIMDLAKSIVFCARHSPTRADSVTRLSKLRKVYATRNEATFMHKFYSSLIRTTRHVPIKDVAAEDDEGEPEAESPLNLPAWESKSWELDDLDDNTDREFVKDSIPKLQHPDERFLNKLLKDKPRIANPKPDVAYGYADSAFTAEQRALNFTYDGLAQISPGINHTFFIVEAKTNGIIEEVENQCCRGGAALVSATRQLLAKLHADPLAGADADSMAFSLALIPSLAEVHVHWVETAAPDAPAVFHMALVSSYALKTDGALQALRRDVSNILDWGVLRRKPGIVNALDQIVARTRDALTPPPPAKRVRGNDLAAGIAS